MKIKNIYICIITLFFTTMAHAEYDELLATWGYPDPSAGLTNQYLPDGSTVGYDYSYGGRYGLDHAAQSAINYHLSLVASNPNNNYKWEYREAKYVFIGNISPYEYLRYNNGGRTLGPGESLIPIHTDENGATWYMLVRNYTKGFFELKITTTLDSQSKSSVGYHFDTTFIPSSPSSLTTVDPTQNGGINFGGIDKGPVISNTSPVLFKPTSSVNLIDKLTLKGTEFRTLIDVIKKGPNTIRNTPYVYIDSNGDTRLGYLTIIRTSDGKTTQYFHEDRDDFYVKLPQVNGIELHTGGYIGNDYSYNADGIVLVTKWNGTNTQPALQRPNTTMLLDDATGDWLIISISDRDKSSYSQVYPPTAYYNAIPRIIRSNVDTEAGSNFQKGYDLFQKSSLTLSEALFVKREWMDIAIPDLKGAIDVEMQKLFEKIKTGLPTDQKPNAENLLILASLFDDVVLTNEEMIKFFNDPLQTNCTNCITNPIYNVQVGQGPTPYPKGSLGNPSYYIWRVRNFLRRNPSLGFPGLPEYYIKYGHKYITRFTTETNDKLSADGKKWLPEVRKNLQVAIENKLVLTPDIELNNLAFKQFAFGTHVDAYWNDQIPGNTPLYKLSTVDLVAIVLTPNFKDLKSPEGIDQAKKIMQKLAGYWINNPTVGAKRGTELVINSITIRKMAVDKALREAINPDEAITFLDDILKYIPK